MGSTRRRTVGRTHRIINQNDTTTRAGRLEAPGVLLLFNIFYAVTGVRLYPGESLIIFDEARQFPRARAAIKYLVADGRYLYVETGSLVSIREHVKDIVIPSEERHLRMYPMDCEEFMWAIGQELLYDEIVRHFQKGRPMGQALHRRVMDCFRQYLLVGGMPQAVQEYVSSHDFPAVDVVERRILDLYRGDIHKHAAAMNGRSRQSLTKFLSNWGAMRKGSFSPLWAVEPVFENMKVPFWGLTIP